VRLVILLAIVLLLILLFALWRIHASARDARIKAETRAKAEALAAEQAMDEFVTLHHLTLIPPEPPETAPTLSGNFPTRADRRRATAEARAILPAARIDFTDDESLLASANDVLALLSDGTSLAVSSAANRSIALAGRAPSPDALHRALEALRADLPRLETIDHSAVILDSAAPQSPEALAAAARLRRARSAQNAPQGVRGVLSTPYPYLLLGNGTRILEGATLGDSTVVRIEPDRVTLTNSSGRFEWKP
jgi:hypothetical protein